MRRILFGLLLAGGVACSESIEPLPFQVGVQASATVAARGDTITFTITAQGGSLIGVETDFGDGSSDLYATAGARSAKVTFRHAYETAGTFTVRAIATDVSAGQKDATLQVQIN